MTAVAEDLDLSWIRFTDDPADEEDCDGLFEEDDCALEPVVVAVWKTFCPCADDETRHCADHRDELARAVAEGRLFACTACRTAVLLLRLEPVR
jgi:hypothetical protein